MEEYEVQEVDEEDEAAEEDEIQNVDEDYESDEDNASGEDNSSDASAEVERGILCIWDPNLFRKDQHVISDNFVAIYETWLPTHTKILIISVYVPQSSFDKRILWSYITDLISRWNGESLVMGDFNEVRYERDRMGSVFNVRGAQNFNSFISNAGLVDIQLEGYAFTWSHPSAAKIRGVTDKILFARLELTKQIHDIKVRASSDQMQKAKIQWAIEGDKNSKYFHGIVNGKRVNLSVKGIMVDDQIIELERPVSIDEIHKAVWSCGENKSPGPDGFSFELSRKFWSTIGPDICIAMEWLFALENDKDCTVATKMQGDIQLSFRHQVRGGIEASQLVSILDLLQLQVMSNVDDRWVWDLNGEWVFRVKDARDFLDECFLPKDDTATRWVKYIPIKVNIFAWKLYLDGIPTRSNLVRRGVQMRAPCAPSLAPLKRCNQT
nr:RNA-directed DNA polymerase, eukaryota [Tanacetum cinerariifolium]